jgi:ATP-binding cassette subfamily F protein uup
LLLAKLFAQPSNLLVMDEPTNDLDVETLELLEDLLGEYRGTLLLVSHDREFIDNVVTSTLVLEGDGRVGEYVGGYSDWLRKRPGSRESTIEPRDTQPNAPQKRAPTARKLTYKDARELELLPARLEALEAEIAARTQAMHDPAFFKQDSAAVTAANQALAALQAELDTAYARWQELEN